MKMTKKILVVEDNLMNKVLVKEILSIKGYQIIEAVTGKEAIEKAMAEKPDLILMDLQLPEMDGVTATKLIKEKEEFRDTPVVALTASAMKGDEEKILKEGFDGYVPKPIEVKKLLDVVEENLK
ncbi:MAG TPA: response regulator [Deltaproteobacteria bacterium]|nr:response regulator [Deltaproteobacteria bacterium]